MATKGTILPESYPPPPNLSYFAPPNIAVLRPFPQMLDYHHFSCPTSFSDAAARLRFNADYFLANYTAFLLLHLLLILIWHPISFPIFIAVQSLWLYLYFLRASPVEVCGRLVSDRVVLITLGPATIAFLLTMYDATEVFGALVVGLSAVLIHAVIRRTDNLVAEPAAGG